MEIFVHFPNTEKGMRELEKVVAYVHSEAIISYIKNTSYTTETKRK